MHIKQVVIRGFKTYKDQVSLNEDFHKGVNVVVGNNGSGKSNFFNAILFVVSDHFGTLRAEMRKQLLHEGAGPAVLTAFVEIVFDNTDRRMPIDKEDVRVRRTIGVKKDEYSLDGKHATKAEVFSLLESCGFTRSNPYYIVRQGKVSELTLMNDRKRLELIKEISGASVYDERKSDSDRILGELRLRQDKTDEVIEMIAQRIRSLEEEQRELVDYQCLERQRRCIEFELTDRDWRTAQDRMDALEFEKRDAAVQLHVVQHDEAELRAKIQAAEAEVQQMSGRRQRLAVEHEEVEKSCTARLEVLTKARLELSDMIERAREAKSLRSEAEAEVQRIRADMEEVRTELQGREQEFAAEASRRREMLQRKHVLAAQRDQYLAKQGRRSQYSSIQQRNEALGEEVRSRRAWREEGARRLQACEDERLRAEGSAQEAVRSKEARRKQMKQLEGELDTSITPQLNQINEQLEASTEKQRVLLLERERLARQRDDAERQVIQCQNQIEGTMPRPQRKAMTGVKQWIEKQGLQHRVYGTLMDNIEVPSTHFLAVENIAGNALFNLLVEDDDVAGEIISFVRRESLGSIVCTPLNRVGASRHQYPSIPGVQPLVDVISGPEWVGPVVQQVFGRTVICSTLELCDEISRTHGLDAITLEGDKVSSRGTLTGGYQDPTRLQRLQLAKQRRQAAAEVEGMQPRFAEFEAQAQEISEHLKGLYAERQSLQDNRGQRRAEWARAREAAQETESQAMRLQELVSQLHERRAEIENNMAECDAAIGAMEAEMRTAALGDLTPAESTSLEQLLEGLSKLDAELEVADSRVYELQRVLTGREQHLRFALRGRLNELESQLIRDSHNDDDELLSRRTKSAARLEQEHADLRARLEGSKKELAEVDALLSAKRSGYDQLMAEDQQLQAKIAEGTSRMDDITMKVNRIVKKKNEADEKLRSLTIVSSDMSKYKPLTATQLIKELGNVNKELGKFENVNKKAIDQFATFTDQLQDLEQKRKEINESWTAVEDVAKRVDDRKEATLLQTVEQIDRHFKVIFADLVRGGIGKLRMLGPDDTADDDTEANGQTSGVRIEVSFTGQSTSFLTMSQLSGGQKTVVAIALVFAIQRREPAPFYLFDEIDAALDAQYRASVAKLIDKNAKNAQMVISTFRPEITEVANRLYRVYQKNRVSWIECVPQHEARRVIEEHTQLENSEG